MAGSVITRLLASQGQYVDLESNQVVSGTKLIQILQTPNIPTVDNDVVNKQYHDNLINYTSGINALSQWTQTHLTEVENYASGTAGTGSGSNPALESYASGVAALAISNQQRITTLEASTGITKLTDNLYIYVNSDTGSDTINNGTSGSPFQTIQKAINYLVQNYDISTYKATIKLYDGDYTQASYINLRSYYGTPSVVNYLSGCCVIEGNTQDKTKTNIICSGNLGFYSVANTPWLIKDLTCTAVSRGTGWNSVFTVNSSASIIYFNNIKMQGNIAFGFMAQKGGKIINFPTDGTRELVLDTKTCVCLAGSVETGSLVSFSSMACIFNQSAMNFTSSFVWAEQLGHLVAQNTTFSGHNASVTGTRYILALNSLIFTSTNNTSFFPGNAAGLNSLHQQYY